MIYGYLRVSSDAQDVQSQKQGVVSFAQQNFAQQNIDEFITDEGVSGGKDPDKRNLGPLLKKIQKGDVIIASEISRLGRDLYMIMDILHFCMERGCTIYTVKDKFVLGDDIQSKVLAFAFGLSAEIERQMIRQRTKEGLKLRIKMGVLVGRPVGSCCAIDEFKLSQFKDKILEQVQWGVPNSRIAKNFNVNRNTLYSMFVRWGVKLKATEKIIADKENAKERNREAYGRTFKVVPIDDAILTDLIMQDLTIPQISEHFPQYTYDQVYDTILTSEKYNNLYRKHGQLKIKKRKL